MFDTVWPWVHNKILIQLLIWRTSIFNHSLGTNNENKAPDSISNLFKFVQKIFFIESIRHLICLVFTIRQKFWKMSKWNASLITQNTLWWLQHTSQYCVRCIYKRKHNRHMRPAWTQPMFTTHTLNLEPTYVLGCAVCDVRMIQPLSERNLSVHIDARLCTTSVSAFHCSLSDLFIRSLRRSHLRNSHLFTTTMATQRRHASIFLVLVMNGAFNYKNTYMKKKTLLDFCIYLDKIREFPFFP